MSRRAKRHNSGGRTGQHHSKTPSGLRSYEVPPAGPVTVTRADGTIEVQPPARAQRTPPPPRRRGSGSTKRQSADPVPIERIRPADAGSLPDREERRKRDAAQLAAQGKSVVATPTTTTGRRRPRVDNGD